MSNLSIPYDKLLSTFEEILRRFNFTTEKSRICAELFAGASLDGVASHGANRFPLFLEMIRDGYIVPDTEPVQTFKAGSFERWDGKLGPGNVNAWYSMKRAIELAHQHGIGCIALGNTNHWMRGGSYGWQAADAGMIGICFTNTKPNMPAWGSDEPKLGNNPLVIAVPRKDGPIVLDMAMSQFSYGKMETYQREKKQLPYDAGFDKEGNLTRDPSTIIENELALPAGLWKGAGLSLVLDLIASTLSDGKSTYELGKEVVEFGLSQFFIVLNPDKLGVTKAAEQHINRVIEDLKSSSSFNSASVNYPGENTLEKRNHHLKHGVPVTREVWEKILSYQKNP